MQPFDKHTADVGGLENSGSGLAQNAAGALTNATNTQQAYSPAIANWTGVGAPEMASAGKPVQTGAQTSNVALAWAGVVAQYWAAQIKEFNKQVDQIVSNLGSQGPDYGAKGDNGKAPTADAVNAARTSATNAAKDKWWQAYHEHITTGGAKAAAMLKEGPTAANVAEAKRVGSGPDGGNGSWNPLTYWMKGFEGFAIPPLDGPLGTLGLAGWGLGRLGTGFGLTASWMTKVKYGVYVNGYFRSTPNGGRIWVDPYWRSMPGKVDLRAGWTTAGKWAGRGGTVLAVATGGLTQWMNDSGRTDLDTSAKVGRAATRGALAGAGGWAGATVGAEGGAALGTMICPGVGTVIGGAVGGLIGGVVGSGVGNMVADHVVDFAGKAADKVVGVARDVGHDFAEGAKKVGHALNPANWF